MMRLIFSLVLAGAIRCVVDDGDGAKPSLQWVFVQGTFL